MCFILFPSLFITSIPITISSIKYQDYGIRDLFKRAEHDRRYNERINKIHKRVHFLNIPNDYFAIERKLAQ